MDLGLKDKVAVITGGSVGHRAGGRPRPGGGGRALVLVRARRGAGRGPSRARSASATGYASSASPPTSPRPRVRARWSSAVDEAFGGADILINNAGTGSEETILEAPDEQWQYYWDLHVMAAVRLARGLAPA